MPNLAGLQSAFAVRTAEVWLTLIELDHEDWDDPIRLVNNTEDIEHNGDTYTAHPFDARLPREDGETIPRMNLTIDVVTATDIRALFRSISTPPTCTAKIILASAPDVVQAGPYVFPVKRRSMNADALSLELSPEDVLGRKYPDLRMTPATVPGLFK